VPKDGEITEVRLSSSIQQNNGSGNAVGGAIAGAVVAGPIGAIIGAAAGSDADRVVVSGELLGCKFVARMSDKTFVTFTVTKEDGQEYLSKCSLFRKGDRLTFRSYDHGLSYEWHEPRRIGSIQGEIPWGEISR
jgi:outer membrane lipoprotein SlyB